MTNAAARQPHLVDEAVAVAAVAALNIAVNRVPKRWEVPAGAGAAALMVALASWSGARLSSEGLDHRHAGAGLRLGLAVGVPAACLVMLGPIIPAVRRFYHDERVVGSKPAELPYHVLLRIPVATALAEEVIFRSALVGIFGRRRPPVAAAAISSALFGLWHIIPTIERLHTNPGASALHRGDVRRQALAVVAAVGATAVAGMAFCWLQWRSRSVVAPIVVHSALNGAALVAGWVASGGDRSSGSAAAGD